jgi:hypothetical protein
MCPPDDTPKNNSAQWDLSQIRRRRPVPKYSCYFSIQVLGNLFGKPKKTPKNLFGRRTLGV